jgi:thiol-disulfide isomerase/thioredoxin
MDRLHTLMFTLISVAALGLGACKGDAKAPPAPASRTEGAKTAGHQVASVDAFCDARAAAAAAPTFVWPALAGSAAPPAPTKHWQWINAWATWCSPCREEMPRLLQWRDKLAAAGTQVDLTFVSIDDTPAQIAAFAKDHPFAASSLALGATDKGAAWLKSIGLDNGAIPIHVIVNPDGKVRCVRAGAVREQDYDVVAKVFAE